MIDHNRRVQVADELLRRFASALRAAQLYSPSHPLVARNVTLFGETLGIAFGQQRSITLGVVGSEFVVGDVPLPRASSMMSDLLQRLQRAGVERIAIERDVTTEELTGLVQALASSNDANGEDTVLPVVSAHPGRPDPGAAARRAHRGGHGNRPAAVRGCVEHCQSAVAGRGERRQGRSRAVEAARGLARASRRAQSHGAHCADRAQELRQLHVHAHGERLDSDDGAGALARARRRGAAGVRRRRVDARHRQSPYAHRDPEQAGSADGRRVRDHEAPRRSTAPRSCAGRRRSHPSLQSSPSSTICGSTAAGIPTR